MRRSLRTHITTRVLVLSATVAVLLSCILIVLIVVATAQRDASRVAFASQQALTLSRGLQASLVTVDRDLRAYVSRYPKLPSEPLVATLEGYSDQQRELAELVSGDPAQRARVREIASKLTSYRTRTQSLIKLARTDLSAATNQLVYTDNRDDAVEDLRALASRVASRARMVTRERQKDAESQSRLAIAFGIGGLALVLIVVAGGTLYLRRAIVRPVVSVARATGRLATGDLATRVPATRADEVGDLGRGFNAMADSLERGRVELERSNAELTRSNRELEQFASVTSHDLQAPLTTISMYTELLDRRRGQGPGGGDDLIGGIRGATHQARRLIADLLEYSRAGRGDLSVEPLQAATVVEQALEVLAGAIEVSGARVQVGSMPVVLADRSNLCRVFQNLISNAVKFTRGDDPQVSVEAEPDGPLWRFDVRDNGIGIKQESARSIFEPFRRLHGEEDYAGTGIGLAVCERIVEQHGGRIWVSSVPGEGSVFSFTMPAAQLPDAPPADAATPPVTAAT